MIDADFSELDGCKLNKKLQEKVDNIKSGIEKQLAAYCLPLRRVAVFSNGEGVYERATL